MLRPCALAACALLLIASHSAPAAAQDAVTITGHVSATSQPVRGATVRVEELNLTTTTDANGRYSFIIPSSRVRGQTVTLAARYLRYRQQSVRVVLVGGSLVQDFALVSADVTAAPVPAVTRPIEPPTDRPVDRTRRTDTVTAGRVEPTTRRRGAATGPGVRLRMPLDLPGPRVDAAVFTELGAVDLPSALSGRLPNVEVHGASVLGGSSAITVRGPHSIVGVTQPLFVVNGIIVDDANVAITSQRVGRGGVDYGSAIGDLNLEDIASVQLLRGPAASMRYGGRAANGVLLVTTRNGAGLSGFDVSASQQVSFESPLRLAEYQNAYGQGLGGRFSFFDGQGGGVNDSVAQSWGPAFVDQALSQHSFTTAATPEVRFWVPQPGNVSGYFERGRTLATNVAAQGANERAQFRLSIANRHSTGLTPSASLTRQSATLTASGRATDALQLHGDLQYLGTRASDRPGSGFDESNPVSVFSQMGRQVDVATLRERRRDNTRRQISWNYAGHNNPYFAPLENDESDRRTRVIGGGGATYDFSPALQGSLRGGLDHYTETRELTVAPGWMGGFPTYAGRGDFTTGGFETDRITSSRSNLEALLRAAPAPSGAAAFAFTLGAGRRGARLNTTNLASDRVPTPATIASADLPSDAHTNYLLGGIEATVRDAASLSATVRQESSSLLGGSSASELYPAVLASVDLTRLGADAHREGTLGHLTVRGGWSRSGNDASPALLQRFGASATTAAALAEQVTAPETTTGWEVGAAAGLYGDRVALDVAYFDERSENLLVGFTAGSPFTNTGSLSNKGIEAHLDLVPLRLSPRVEWRVGLEYGKNTGLVESLGNGIGTLFLGDPFGGASLEARPGTALAAIVGTTSLRNANGQLLLRNGAPLPDTIVGARVLGTSAPSWTGGLSSGLRLGMLDLRVLFDAQRGGRVFSASNRAGAYSGALAETSFRPDTGLLIPGVDVATGSANAQHVTTEDYYHALGAITERWVYDASFVKLREVRASLTFPLIGFGVFRAQSFRASVVGRNLAIWTDAPNLDPESVLSTSTFRGLELGQLPTARSVGVQFTLTP